MPQGSGSQPIKEFTMKKFIFLLVISLSIHLIFAEIAPSVEVATAGDDDFLIYDNEYGICQDGDNIFITYYRYECSEVSNFRLMLAVSTDGGTVFTENFIAEFSLENHHLPDYYENFNTPAIWLDDAAVLHLFYLNLHTASPQVATSSDLGQSFNFSIIEGLPHKSSFQLVNTSQGLKIGALYSKAKIPLSFFQHLSYYENNENVESYLPHNYSIKFWGIDHLQGPVYTADYLTIWQFGGGINNGWPLFENIVLSGQEIIDYATGQPAINSAPMNQIFQGGYIEEACSFILPAQAIAVRENGIILEESANHDVLMAIIDGNIAHLRYADRITQTQNFTVYNSFPDPLRPD